MKLKSGHLLSFDQCIGVSSVKLPSKHIKSDHYQPVSRWWADSGPRLDMGWVYSGIIYQIRWAAIHMYGQSYACIIKQTV